MTGRGLWSSSRRTLGAFVFLLLGPAAQAATADSPRALVMGVTDQMLTALKVSGDDIKRNPALARRMVENRVLPLIDFPRIARGVLGKHWRRANPEQRERFTREFTEFLINLYVTAMVTYVDDIVSVSDDIHFPPIHWSPGETRAKVRMLVRLKAGGAAEVVYRMDRNAQGWRIYDVTVLGVSFTATYRQNFSAEIARGGLDALIARLAARNRRSH